MHSLSRENFQHWHALINMSINMKNAVTESLKIKMHRNAIRTF